MRSPRTSPKIVGHTCKEEKGCIPQLPQTISPEANSSTIFELSLHSGQVSVTFRFSRKGSSFCAGGFGRASPIIVGSGIAQATHDD